MDMISHTALHAADSSSSFHHVAISDEALFHISGYVNCYNVKIWEMENTRATADHL
jgi:hypothetical protein